MRSIKLKAVLCHHVRKDRNIEVKLINNNFQIITGDCVNATFSTIDYHNNNRAYWIRLN